MGSAYYLDAVGGLTGPLLSYNGAPVTAGQFGAWTPLGAEWTGNGYAVAWKMAGVDQYTMWNTDSGGNYVSQTNQMFGSSSALEAYEPVFAQDLNGDGRSGVPRRPSTSTWPTRAIRPTGPTSRKRPCAGSR